MFSKWWKWARKESALMASMWEHVTPLTSCPVLENRTRDPGEEGGRVGEERRGKKRQV